MAELRRPSRRPSRQSKSDFECPGDEKKAEKKRASTSSKAEEKNEKSDQKEELDEFAKTRIQREKCQKVWEESWEKKLKDDECMEDYKECCAPDNFFKKPKLQTNIWVQVKHEKNTQHVQMAFMDLPIPKDKCPPYPKRKKPEEEKPCKNK